MMSPLNITIAVVVAAGIGWLIWRGRKVAGPLDPDSGMPNPLLVNGLDHDLKLVDFGALSRGEAEALLRERYAQAGVTFEQGEEAVSKTQLGFARSADHFLDVHCHGAAEIRVMAGRAAAGSAREEEAVLTRYEELSALVDAYYRRVTDFESYWQALPNRKKI